MGVSFDLTALSYVDGYRIRDNRNNSGTPFDYYVSVCNDMGMCRTMLQLAARSNAHAHITSYAFAFTCRPACTSLHEHDR